MLPPTTVKTNFQSASSSFTTRHSSQCSKFDLNGKKSRRADIQFFRELYFPHFLILPKRCGFCEVTAKHNAPDCATRQSPPRTPRRCPRAKGPTPAGVPVAIKSPGTRVIIRDNHRTK